MANTESEKLSALELENQRLRRAVNELSVLNEVAAAIGGERDTQLIMKRLVSRVVSTVGCEQGVVTLVDNQPGNVMDTLVRTVSSSAEHQILRPDDNLIGWMHLHKQALVVNDPTADPRFKSQFWNPAIRSLCSVPLLVHGKLIGILTVYNRKDPGGFDDNDKRLLSILATQSAQVIESARLYEDEKEFIELQQQMDLARKIQDRLLPHDSPDISGFDIAGFSRPAQSVGGDFFNVVPVSDDKTYLWVGDVSGKGVPASLTMANTQAVLHSHAEAGRTVGECISIANDLLTNYTPKNTFVTLLLTALSRDGKAEICNAGHVKPFLVRADGTLEIIEESDLVLGVMKNRNFGSVIVSMDPGDCLVLYSDGVSEAMDEYRDQLGDEVPMQVVVEHRSEMAEKIVAALVNTTDGHSDGVEQADDITILVAKRMTI